MYCGPMSVIYLDHHATTSVDPVVLKEMLPYFTEKFGNPASGIHSYGWQANEATEVARERVAKLLKCTSHEIIFTSGATESNNFALYGVVEGLKEKGRHIISTAFEHKSVLSPLKHLETKGYKVTYIKPDSDGRISVDAIKEALQKDTILITVMWANNEIGSIQNIRAIGKLAKEAGVLFHTDATQSLSYVACNVEEDGVDLLSLSGHKMYGPKGVGALYVRRKNPRVAIEALIRGGSQERGLRGGTLNVPAIVGLGKCAELTEELRATECARIEKLRNSLWEKISQTVEGAKLHGTLQNRLPGNLNFHIDGVQAEGFLRSLSEKVAFSTGSACLGAGGGSHVLESIGISDDAIASSVRLSLGRKTNENEILLTLQAISDAAKENKTKMVYNKI